MCAGWGAWLLERAVDYAQQREVGGKPIADQQVVQHMLANMHADIYQARATSLVAQAELDLQFTELRAPVSGRIGDRRISIGNLVTGGTGGNTTLLAVIRSIDPIRFEFTMDETSYLRFTRIHGHKSGAIEHVPVKLKLIDEDTFGHEGHMDFIDNAIDTSSGAIRLRAEIPNKDGTFTPGMFARVRIPMSPPAEALLVPDSAIGTEQVRKFVLTVDDKNIAQPKYVKLGSVVDGLRVISSGLDPNDRVIINGLLRARPGTPVTPEDGKIAAADAAAAPAKTKTD